MMALPRTISNVGTTIRQSFQGPFLSGGAVYVIFKDSTDTSLIRVDKSSDPDTTAFAEQDATNHPDLAATNLHIWAVQDGTNLHIAHAESGGRVGYSLFDMSDDTWDATIIDETVSTAPDATFGLGGVSVRSDGDVIVFYQGAEENVHGVKQRVDYARREGGSWTSDVALDGGGATDWYVGCAIKGTSDRVHAFLFDGTAQDGYERTLRSDNSLSTIGAFDSDISNGTVNSPIGAGAAYDDGGTERIRAPYWDLNGQVSVVKHNSEDSPTTSVDTDASDVDASAGLTHLRACLAADGTTLHMLYADDATDDIQHDENADDAGWGTDDEELDAVSTGNTLSSAVYVSVSTVNSGDTVLAYLFTNANVQTYNERNLSAAPATVIQDVIGRSGVIPFAR